MDNKFDLQLFDDDAAESQVEENSAVENESSTVELPKEFEGLEDYKDEILAEAAQMQKANESSTEEEAEDVPKGHIPYQRFKQVIDERNALKAQIEELNKARESAPPEQNPPQQRQPPQVQMPQMQLTNEGLAKLKDVVKAEAMRMTQLTDEQVKEIEEYGEEGDDNTELWRSAKQIATENVLAGIRQEQYRRQAQAQQFLASHASAVKNYNDFVRQETQAADYQEVVRFATGEYFDSLPQAQQQALANSYVRVERQTASPAEIMLVQSYYAQAKAAFAAKKSKTQSSRKTSSSAVNLPKVDRLSGSSGNTTGSLTAADFERIIDQTEDFDKLDPRIKAIFEN